MKHTSVSYKVALGGIVSSLCVLSMFLAGVIPIFYLVLPMIAGALMMIIVMEVDWRWAFVTYIAVSVLSVFVTFDKQAALIFIILFGHYPITKYLIDGHMPKWLGLILKFIIFNLCIVAYFYISVYLLGAKELVKSIHRFGKYSLEIVLGVLDLFFFTYDPSLDAFTEYFREKIEPALKGGQKKSKKTN